MLVFCKKVSKILNLILICSICVSLLGCNSKSSTEYNTSNVEEFDSNMIQLSFGALSDTHIGDKNTEESFRNILQCIQDFKS